MHKIEVDKKHLEIILDSLHALKADMNSGDRTREHFSEDDIWEIIDRLEFYFNKKVDNE